jgi:hypothetical protein
VELAVEPAVESADACGIVEHAANAPHAHSAVRYANV